MFADVDYLNKILKNWQKRGKLPNLLEKDFEVRLSSLYVISKRNSEEILTKRIALQIWVQFFSFSCW